MLLIIDNYDSFTYNLVQLFQPTGIDLCVLRNDDQDIMAMVHNSNIQGIIISPGPGRPETSGCCLSLLQILAPDIPVLGVCLGHQILAFWAGLCIRKADQVIHGKTSQIFHNQTGLFNGIANPFPATRYHSLIMSKEPKDLSHSLIKITAYNENGEPMALKYIDRPWFGVQFHPESILTREGPKLIENFVGFIKNKEYPSKPKGENYVHQSVA